MNSSSSSPIHKNFIENITEEQSLFLINDSNRDDYICGICSEIMLSPIEVLCCGKLYCTNCADKCFGTSSTFIFPPRKCAFCKQNCTGFHLSKRAQLKILDTSFKCYINECPFKDNLRNVINHVNISCDYILRPCRWCNTEFKNPDMEIHNNTCDDRPIKCPHCKISFKFKDNHENVCPEKIISCNRCSVTFQRKTKHLCQYDIIECSCGDKYQRGNVKSHNIKCPDVIVSCPHKDWSGCDNSYKRSIMDIHSKNIDNHILHAKKYTENLNNVVTRLTSENIVAKRLWTAFARIGQKIDAKDNDGIWYRASIASIEKNRIAVRFTGRRNGLIYWYTDAHVTRIDNTCSKTS